MILFLLFFMVISFMISLLLWGILEPKSILGIIKKGDLKRPILFISIVIFVTTIIFVIFSSIQFNRINVNLNNSTRRQDYIYLIKPLYSKIDLEENNNFTYLNKEIEVKNFKENKYLICKGQDFLGNSEDKYYGHDYYTDFNYKIEYDEYFRILKKLINNLGGYCKVKKEIKYYVDNSAFIQSSKEFNSIKELEAEIEKRWKENLEIESINYKKEIEKDKNNINSNVTYRYKIKIPTKYYEILDNYNRDIIIYDRDLGYNLEYKYTLPELYEENPFLSIIYLEQMLNNRLSIFLNNIMK